MGWTLLTYRLPTQHSRARVAVWREVRRAGALHLQQSVVAWPDGEQFDEAVERFRSVVHDVGGETLVLSGDAPAGDDERLIAQWNDARSAEYAELVRVAERFLAEIDHEFEIEKFTLAELEEEESELEKLQRWHARIKQRDIHGAPRGPDADAVLARAVEAFERYTAAVFERTQP
jgi:hypothetical protein